jgi:hypothetical protein
MIWRLMAILIQAELVFKRLSVVNLAALSAVRQTTEF